MTDSSDAYEQHAKTFLETRDVSAVGSNIVEQWCKKIPARACGLELGCGGGYPITQLLDAADFKLWAIDSSPTLVAAFESRFPQIPVRCERVQESDFFGLRFDFVVSVGLLFLLDESDQEKLTRDVAKVLLPGGRWLLTAPVETGDWVDALSGIHCMSLGTERYHQLFNNAGFKLEAQYVDHGENNYYDLVL